MENTIYINIDHKDFIDRAQVDKNGRPKLSPRLAAYLANELSCHYQLSLHNNSVPGERTKLYDDLFDSAYTMEGIIVKRLETLRKRVGKSLD